jgi:hypothetical protein
VVEPAEQGRFSGLAFEREPVEGLRQCHECGDAHAAVHGFINQNGAAHAVFYADWYPHAAEAYIDVVFGTWGDDEYRDQVTFGCRIGHVSGQESPAASLVPAAEVRPDHPMFGVKLNRQQALDHPLVSEFWRVIDWLILNEPMLHANVYHMD